MNTLVISETHHLLPLAWRLKKELEPTHKLEVVVVHKRYQDAWAGRLQKAKHHPGKGVVHFDEWVQPAMDGELRVLTDSPKAMEQFKGAPHLFGLAPSTEPDTHPELMMGAWFDKGDITHPHWVVPDWGLWPGGLGADVLGGATMIEPPVFRGPVAILEALRAPLEEFRGLVSVGLKFVQASRDFQAVGYQAGWPWLHSGLFAQTLPSLVELLDGKAEPTPGPRFSVGIPVSQAPWPFVGTPKPASVELQGLSPEVTKHVLFHDIRIERGSEVWTGGNDGLVGVAHGQGRLPALARARSLAVANQLSLPEGQARTDVGSQVDRVLMAFEPLGLW